MDIARLKVDPGSPHYDKADYPEHPYSAKAPYNEAWIRVCEVTFDGKGGIAQRGEPISWGTFGEYLDHAIESGCVDSYRGSWGDATPPDPSRGGRAPRGAETT